MISSFFFLLLFQVNIVGTMLRGEPKFFRSIYNICLELFLFGRLGMKGKMMMVGLLKIILPVVFHISRLTSGRKGYV